MGAKTPLSADVERFPAELRRWRTARGLSQLDLAIRAGTTQRHVSFIEQGRSRPGRDVVMRLAESLDLTLREWNELLAAASFAPAFPESRSTTRHSGRSAGRWTRSSTARSPIRTRLQHASVPRRTLSIVSSEV